MRKIYFILIAISFMSCSKEKCNDELSEKDYYVIHYKKGNTVIATISNEVTNEQKKVNFIAGDYNLNRISKSQLGMPIPCDGTYDLFYMWFKSDDKDFMLKIDVILDNEKYALFTFEINIQNKKYGFLMRPFAPKISKYYDDDLKYFSKIKIDEKEYEDVYLIKEYSKSNIYLYYSGKTGFIKLTNGNTEILFENK